MWAELDSSLKDAQSKVKAQCQTNEVALENAAIEDLSEWKLYHLHKAAKKKAKQAGSGIYSQPTSDWMADLCAN